MFCHVSMFLYTAFVCSRVLGQIQVTNNFDSLVVLTSIGANFGGKLFESNFKNDVVSLAFRSYEASTLIDAFSLSTNLNHFGDLVDAGSTDVLHRRSEISDPAEQKVEPFGLAVEERATFDYQPRTSPSQPGKRPVWYCCQCEDGPYNPKIHVGCANCPHRRCGKCVVKTAKARDERRGIELLL